MPARYQGPQQWILGDSMVVADYAYQPTTVLISPRLCDVPAATLMPEVGSTVWWGMCPSCHVYYGDHTTDCPEVGSEEPVPTDPSPA